MDAYERRQRRERRIENTITFVRGAIIAIVIAYVSFMGYQVYALHH